MFGVLLLLIRLSHVYGNSIVHVDPLIIVGLASGYEYIYYPLSQSLDARHDQTSPD